MRVLKNEMSEKQILEQIAEKLEGVILTIALHGRPKEEQIKYLANNGYSNSEMANMLAIPKGTIDSIRASFVKKGHGK